MNSYDLFRLWLGPEDLWQQRMGTARNTKDYYRRLMVVIFSELREEGRSVLVEEALAKRIRELDDITLRAMLNGVTAAANIRVQSVPQRMLDELGVWPFGRGERVEILRLSDGFLQMLGAACASVGQTQMLLKELQDLQPLTNPESEARRIVDKARAEAAIIDKQTRARENESKDRTEMERQQILATARAQAEEIRKAAHKDAAEMKTAVQQELQAYRETQTAEIREEAMRRAEEEARAKSQDMIRRNLQDYMRSRQTASQEHCQQLEELSTQITGENAKVREDLCAGTNRMQADMTRMMEETVARMNDMKNQLHKDLRSWQESLYKNEAGQLLNCYNNLQILLERFRREAAQEQLAGSAPEGEQTMLQAHCVSLEKFSNRMERALNALGMRVFWPKAGDAFDSYYHALDDDEVDEEQCIGMEIASCSRPGILRTVNSNDEVVAHRATVKLISGRENIV